jgi:hypothetical protein
MTAAIAGMQQKSASQRRPSAAQDYSMQMHQAMANLEGI